MIPTPDAHGIEVAVGVEPRALSDRPEIESPFCIALFGDFSARAHRAGPTTVSSRAPIAIDRDNFDAVLGRLRPELHLRVQGERDPAARASFSRLEDFEPDSLYARLPLFDGVRELRQRLGTARSSGQSPGREPPGPPGRGGSLLDQIVEHSSSAEPSPLEGGDLQAYLNRIVAPHLVPGPDPRTQAILTELDTATSEGMRALLHDPEFQELEALWRGVALLTHRIESDEAVRVYLIDASKADLAADLEGVRRLLGQPPPGTDDARWGVLGGSFAVGPEAADLDLMARLGELGRDAGAPWIAAADPRLLGWSLETIGDVAPGEANQGQAWQELRRMGVAPWIGLVLPRVLLRLPYGGRGAPSGVVRFEELSSPPRHEEYLWGNPAFVCLVLLAGGMTPPGRAVYPGMDLELGGFPLYVPPGAPAPQSCAEAVASQGAVEGLLAGGVMVLVPAGSHERVRLVRFQSVADPPAPLAGARLGP